MYSNDHLIALICGAWFYCNTSLLQVLAIKSELDAAVKYLQKAATLDPAEKVRGWGGWKREESKEGRKGEGGGRRERRGEEEGGEEEGGRREEGERRGGGGREEGERRKGGREEEEGRNRQTFKIYVS